MTGSALHRWCVWLYGQALRKHNEDPTHALADVGEIFDFSCSEEDYECANACLDAIRELLVEEHDKVTINLDAFVKFFDGRGDASQMFIDILVYSPCASSGKTREWLSKVNATECWASFFCPLSLAFATRVANEAAGKENQHPDIMARDAYHLPIEEDTSDESAAKSAKS